MDTEYTLEEVAERTHVCLETVRRWVRSGKLKAHNKVGCGKAWFVYESDLNSFVQNVEQVG